MVAAQPGVQHPVDHLGPAHLDVPVDLDQRGLAVVRGGPQLVVDRPEAVQEVQPGVAEQHVAGHRLDLGAVAVRVGGVSLRG
jgi:hypothetical protein